MRWLFPAATVVLGVLAVSIPAPRPLAACASAPERGANGVQIASESALIVYDSTTKTEHFLRTANFDTSSSEFGFFVPTPTKPELAEASGDIFSALAKLTAPKIVERVVHETVWPGLDLFAKSV